MKHSPYAVSSAIAHLWQTHAPHLRFGQMMYAFEHYLDSIGVDIFYLEDDELIGRLQTYLVNLKKS